jgi:adenosylcobyric acid synthase
MVARAIMLQGTGSSVGKSLLVTGLARALVRRGLKVRPFKPQNMSNNAAVTVEGGEIGRAQALQARAALAEPSVHMNPVLLKPQSEIGAQLIVQGKVLGHAKAREFQDIKPRLLPQVLESFGKLKDEADIVLVEGAGSASEINLRRNDIANMGFARAADVPVVVVGDIDRGGVIASLVGTKAVLEPADAALVAGFIVNRMRGDLSLFADGMTEIAARTGWTALGLVPFFEGARRLPAEDAYDLAERRGARGNGKIKIAVPLLPHIANFDDLDPLGAEPEVELIMVERGTSMAVCDLIVLPGSKATIADLATFRTEGWDIDIAAHVRRGGRVLGLCGGYQMLGRTLADPEGIEGSPSTVSGLGLLDVETVISGEKRLAKVSGETSADGVPLNGYEMHMGVTSGPATAAPLVRFGDGRVDGAVSACGRVAGTYVHGFFADDRQRAAWVARLGGKPAGFSYEAEVEKTLDALAQHLEGHMDVDRLLKLAR